MIRNILRIYVIPSDSGFFYLALTRRSAKMRHVYMVFFLACVVSVPAMAQQSEDLNFASGLEQFQNIRRMLPSYLNSIGLRMLEERKHRVERLASIEDVNKRRAYLREKMME